MELTITMNQETYEKMVAHARNRKLRVLGQVFHNGEYTKIWLVKSGSESGAVYEVSRDHCGCQSHFYRGYCSHRAWLWNRLQRKYRFDITFGHVHTAPYQLQNPPLRPAA